MRRALIGLVAAMLGLLVVLHMPPVQWWLVSTALSGLQTRQSLDLTWRDVSFNLVTRSAQIQGLRLGARGASAPLVSAEQVAVRFPFGLFRGKLDGLDVTLASGTVDARARATASGPRFPRRGRAARPGRPPRSLPAFAALRLHDVAVVYDDRDARFRTETKGLRVELLPTGTAPGDLAGDLVVGATTRRALGAARHHADAARGPRAFLAGRRRRRNSCSWTHPRAASSPTCALRSRAPIASR